jgi:hypothetical protein
MRWFRKLCAYIKQHYGPTVICMDGASYHKNRTNQHPVKGGKDKDGNLCWQRDKVIDWLKMRGQELEPPKTLITEEQAGPSGKNQPGLNLIQLFDLVHANTPEPHFEVYDIANEHGHLVYFTPAYCPLSNPIEKVGTSHRRV